MIGWPFPVDGPTPTCMWAVQIRLSELSNKKKLGSYKEVGVDLGYGEEWRTNMIKIHCMNVQNSKTTNKMSHTQTYTE